MYELGKVVSNNESTTGNQYATVVGQRLSPSTNVQSVVHSGQVYTSLSQDNVLTPYGPPAPGCTTESQGFTIGEPYPYPSPQSVVATEIAVGTVWNPVHVIANPSAPWVGTVINSSPYEGTAPTPGPVVGSDVVDGNSFVPPPSPTILSRLSAVPCCMWVVVFWLVLILIGSIMIAVAKQSIGFENYDSTCTDDSMYYDDDYVDGYHHRHHHPNTHDCVKTKCIGAACSQYGLGVAFVVIGVIFLLVTLCCSRCRYVSRYSPPPPYPWQQVPPYNPVIVAGTPYRNVGWNGLWMWGPSGHNIHHNVHHNHGHGFAQSPLHHHHFHGHNVHHNVHHNHGGHHHR